MPEPDGRSALTDTIFAPATGTGRAAIAIVRLSGPRAHEAVRALTRTALPPWRVLALRTLLDASGEILDRAMVVVFPEGASHTGEAMAEIHCHGSSAVLSDLLHSLGALHGLRLAEPGEFTRRSLFSGRMDLSEVEGLSDLLAAETSGQRRQALRIHSGAVSRRVAGWRGMLLRARALLEATIDFADEEVPEEVPPEAATLLRRATDEMEQELSHSSSAQRMRSGYEVAIVGPPNVGKSSLLNAVAGREAAIVSDIAGTTRDVLEVRLDLGGLPVTFLDTAGLRETPDAVEGMGVERARRRAAAADLRLFLSAPDVAARAEADLFREGDLVVSAKSDMGVGGGDVAVSALTGEGLDTLLHLVLARLSPQADIAGVLVNARQKAAIETARDHILRSLGHLGEGRSELAAEELRLATGALDRLIGRIGVEDVLGEIFASFCLGK